MQSARFGHASVVVCAVVAALAIAAEAPAAGNDPNMLLTKGLIRVGIGSPPAI